MRDGLVHKVAWQIPALIEKKRGRMSSSARKRRSSSFLSLGCGCTDSKSVSVSGSFGSKSTSTLPPARRVAELSSADTITLTSASSSFYEEEEDVEVKTERSTSTPSFSELLRQLNELERSVIAWGSHAPLSVDGKRDEKKGNPWSSGQGAEDSIVVVKETEDPLGEFRRSMLHMIVENEIVDGAELRELLRRFLALNSQRHHRTILRAFAEIWDDVFSGYEQTPDLLRHGYSRLPPRRHF
ncbi:hypothetical protein BHE74_00041414 [Ensete ventricosum]|uniref:Transcription repressor n=2 Tax=Ensete ventricosum TaxID=4639 RepID=A0A426ZTN5_ENSVE|nr:hypothetical protein B296_00029679 [Ensete ventricosum]RWW52181.1 hypothetical protein BHE74_00041414 [Ensete ventricosum]RZS19406.1 hypothetical protein BHM03_00051795 [Ensete ventricosum]